MSSKQNEEFDFPQALTASGLWTEKGDYVLKERKIVKSKDGKQTDYYAFYEREIGWGFKHAVEIRSQWLTTNPKRLINVKNLSSTCKMKADVPDTWLICNEFYYLTIQDAMDAVLGKKRVYPPKRKPEYVRELSNSEVYEFWDAVKVYDNKGKTIDRYTVIINTDNVKGVVSMSANPNGPSDVNQFVCSLEDLKATPEELGERIPFAKLPKAVQEAIEQRIENGNSE